MNKKIINQVGRLYASGVSSKTCCAIILEMCQTDTCEDTAKYIEYFYNVIVSIISTEIQVDSQINSTP